jgi:hypothetical protein
MLEPAIPSLFRLGWGKADKLTLGPILGCFHGLDESQRCSPYPGLISQPDESKRAEKTLELTFHKLRAKELKRCLSSPCPKSFQAWMRVRRPKSQHLTYPRLFSWPGWEPDSARPISELLYTERNNPTDPTSMLDKTHEDIKTKSKTSWRYTTQRNLDTPTKTKVYIQHVFKEKIQKSGKTTQKDSHKWFKQNSKYVSKEPEFLYKA